MGTWGVSLSSNDLYADIYYEFFELYNEGHAVKDISAKLIAENREIFEAPSDGHNFWFALAKAQWECKELDPGILARVTKIVTSGADIADWRELGASEGDLKKRQIVLDKFLQTLTTERPKPRARRKKSTVVHRPLYHKGDCLAFKFANGRYGGVVVLEEVSGTSEEGSYNLIAHTNINLPHKPTLRDFKRASVLHDKREDVDLKTSEIIWIEYPALYWALSVYPNDAENFTERIGSICVKKKYDVRNYEAQIPTGHPFNKYDVARIETLLSPEQDDTKNKRTKINKFTGSWF